MSLFITFAEYYKEIWGRAPFPWQVRLADEAVNGCWPNWVTLPTGTGKTSVIDIAVYALAAQASLPPETRTAPVRIVFAVNRRIVVDEAFEHAKKIAERLHEAIGLPDCPLHSVAMALQSLADDPFARPLEAFPLRGGTFTDRSWSRSPFQPMVLSTTLDQLGSRLLFRGYGVSEFARPVQAALLANDALLILDEAHTSRAFSQTLSSITKHRKVSEVADSENQMRPPFFAVQLTATPPPDAEMPFGLDDSDREHPMIAGRLRASKPVELAMVAEAKGKDRHGKLGAAIKDRALKCLSEGHRRVLVVVNRVATAEALRELLAPKKGQSDHGASVELLTGRLRPLDRDALVQRLEETYALKSISPADDLPKLIVIATQCIEVGADFDFDALITELAPLDNLRQRFGRLNRYGRDRVSPGCIVTPGEAVNDDANDPIYGEALPKVWRWLQGLEKPDFGLAALEPLLPVGDNLPPLLAPVAEAPILLAPHLDLLCQTSPEPHVSPDPALYIHGLRQEFPEVGVVLRAGLYCQENPLDFIHLTPPLGTEAASVPLPLARRWLSDPFRVRDDSGDCPGEIDTESSSRSDLGAKCIVWRYGEPSWITRPDDLKKGDILVLDAERGESLANLIPLPAEDAEGLDQFEAAHLAARDRLAIRFHQDACEQWSRQFPDSASQDAFFKLFAPLFAVDEDDENWRCNVGLWSNAFPAIAAHLAEHLPTDSLTRDWWDHAAFLSRDPKQRIPRRPSDWSVIPFPGGSGPGALLVNRSRVGASQWPMEPEDLGRQSNEASGQITLQDHSAGVARRTLRSAKYLTSSLRECLTIAAQWHDLGKLDPRFQALLQGCLLHTTDEGKRLAKSDRAFNQVEERKLREALSLPDGFRHELLSASIVASSEAHKDFPERDLLLHLIASHHGRCRSFAPVVVDSNPEPFAVDVDGISLLFPGVSAPMAHLSEGVPLRFWSLTRRYGWWGLPYLESLLRLADQAESANPNRP
jgi:CRISPR-associated endonuclease/helicase Cas3